MEPLVGFISLFATVFGIIYIYLTTRHKERLALIEKGADASLFNTGKEGKFSNFWGKLSLKAGMLAIGISLGILVGAIFANSGMFDEGICYTSMIFLFGGLSLITFYLIDRKSK
jgi:hypothetical protein